MMDINVYSQFDPPPVIKEDFSKEEYVVDTEGVMRTEDLINMFLDAGERLKAGRSYYYNNIKDVEDNDMGNVILNKIDTFQAVSKVKERVANEIVKKKESVVVENKKIEVKEDNVNGNT